MNKTAATIACLLCFATGVLFRDVGQDRQDADRICVSTKPIEDARAEAIHFCADNPYLDRSAQAKCVRKALGPSVPSPRSVSDLMPPSLPPNCETRPAGTFVCT